MKHIFSLCLWLFPLLGMGQTPLLLNPSFEGSRGTNEVPAGWQICHPLSTPDLLPGAWNITLPPQDGNAYLGLVSRGNLDDRGGREYTGTTEDVAAPLEVPLQPGLRYIMSLNLAFFPDWFLSSLAYGDLHYDQPLQLQIFAVNSACQTGELLWTSPVIDHTDWRSYEAELLPSQALVTHLLLRVAPPASVAPAFGNMLIDGIAFNLPEVAVSLPSVFTPNQDGVNDRLVPLSLDGVIEPRLQVFDRWGRVLYEARTPGDLQAGWDGHTARGPAPAGVYFFAVIYLTPFGEPGVSKGSVTLLR
jgi:gliding motility-associated-like protein